MKYMLDTNAWIFLTDSPQQIPKKTLKLVRDLANAPLGLAAISPWEVAKKSALGKLQLALPVRQWLEQATQTEGIRLLPLTPDIAYDSAYLPSEFYRDPADQLIVATARVHNLVLITSDQRIQSYPHVKTFWA